MNPITQQVIEFLSRPELPFGTEEDLLLMSDPQSLRERVASLLEESPAVLGAPESENLKANLSGADWDFIAQEFRARVEVASRFFESDAPAIAPADPQTTGQPAPAPPIAGQAAPAEPDSGR